MSQNLTGCLNADRKPQLIHCGNTIVGCVTSDRKPRIAIAGTNYDGCWDSLRRPYWTGLPDCDFETVSCGAWTMPGVVIVTPAGYDATYSSVCWWKYPPTCANCCCDLMTAAINQAFTCPSIGVGTCTWRGYDYINCDGCTFTIEVIMGMHFSGTQWAYSAYWWIYKTDDPYRTLLLYSNFLQCDWQPAPPPSDVWTVITIPGTYPGTSICVSN